MPKTEKTKFYRVENKYDLYLIKDALQQFITDELRDKWEAKENFRFQNVKCLLGIFIVANVILSHFHVIPWPQDYYILIFCTIVYYITTKIYTVYETKYEQDTFFLFDDKQLEGKQLAFGLKINLESPIVILSISDYPNQNKLAIKHIEVNKYFDEDGYLHKANTTKLIQEMMQQARKQKQ